MEDDMEMYFDFITKLCNIAQNPMFSKLTAMQQTSDRS